MIKVFFKKLFFIATLFVSFYSYCMDTRERNQLRKPEDDLRKKIFRRNLEERKKLEEFDELFRFKQLREEMERFMKEIFEEQDRPSS